MVVDFKPMILIILTFLSFTLSGQEVFKDSLNISLLQAESSFISNNRSLLAEKCNINATKAQIIQAKLFTNITFAATQNVINPEYQTNGSRKWFDTSDKGETSAQVQKLFRLAGKRNKQIQIAELSANREEQIYFDLLRTLKYTLRSDFYNLFYLNQIVKVYDKEIASMHKLIDAYQSQVEKGFISKKELPESQEKAQSSAWNRTLRTFRGTDCNTPGACFTKDTIYRDGNIGIWDVIGNNPDEMLRFNIGKYDPANPRHIWILEQIGISDKDLSNLER